jgi:hypothetical protein
MLFAIGMFTVARVEQPLKALFPMLFAIGMFAVVRILQF